MKNKQYFCTVFFMVLDFKVKKRLGCRETTLFVFSTLSDDTYLRCRPAKPVSLEYSVYVRAIKSIFFHNLFAYVKKM